jgi:outer membrane lipoprotein-sorting protein
MNRSHTGRSIAIGTALVLSIALARAADDLPKAETILDKYIEATGGKAAYEKHHSEITKGTMEMAAMGIKGTVTSYRLEPDKTYSEVDLPAIGKMRDGSDGKVFWSLSAMVGPHVKEGPEKTQAILMDRMNSELNWRDLYKEVKTTGVETVDGKECYKVVLTPNEGGPITQYYDKQSNLMVKMTMTAQSPMGEQAMDMFASDYRKEGDILMPHKMKQSVAGQEIVFTIDSVTFNADIAKDRFDLPDEIKALVNKK